MGKHSRTANDSHNWIRIEREGEKERKGEGEREKSKQIGVARCALDKAATPETMTS